MQVESSEREIWDRMTPIIRYYMNKDGSSVRDALIALGDDIQQGGTTDDINWITSFNAVIHEYYGDPIALGMDYNALVDAISQAWEMEQNYRNSAIKTASEDFIPSTPVGMNKVLSAVASLGWTLTESKTSDAVGVTDGNYYVWLYFDDEGQLDGLTTYGQNVGSTEDMLEQLATTIGVDFWSEHSDEYQEYMAAVYPMDEDDNNIEDFGDTFPEEWKQGRVSKLSGFTLWSADIHQLAQDMREKLLSRPDVQEWSKGMFTDPMEPVVYDDMSGAEAKGWPKDKILERFLKIVPDEGYKLMPWVIRAFKNGEILPGGVRGGGNLGHAEDIIARAAHWWQWSREHNKSLPDFMAKDFDFSKMEQWVYEMNAQNIEGTEWQASEPVYVWEDGWHMDKVGSADLALEGELMGHCVGGYCDMVDRGESTIYSLRDPKGQPHVTIEVAGSYDLSQPAPRTPMGQRYELTVVQVQGKGDTVPIDEYQDRVNEWFGYLENAKDWAAVHVDDPDREPEYIYEEHYDGPITIDDISDVLEFRRLMHDKYDQPQAFGIDEEGDWDRGDGNAYYYAGRTVDYTMESLENIAKQFISNIDQFTAEGGDSILVEFAQGLWLAVTHFAVANTETPGLYGDREVWTQTTQWHEFVNDLINQANLNSWQQPEQPIQDQLPGVYWRNNEVAPVRSPEVDSFLDLLRRMDNAPNTLPAEVWGRDEEGNHRRMWDDNAILPWPVHDFEGNYADFPRYFELHGLDRLQVPGTFARVSMAMTPEMWGEVLHRHPYFYHVTEPRRIERIEAEGIHAEHDDPAPGIPARDGFVYLFTELEDAMTGAEWWLGMGPDCAILTIDATQLDSELVEADEDYLSSRPEGFVKSFGGPAPDEHHWDPDWIPDIEHDVQAPWIYAGDPGNPWAMEHPRIGDPDVTWGSYAENRTVAYHGIVPASAILEVKLWSELQDAGVGAHGLETRGFGTNPDDRFFEVKTAAKGPWEEIEGFHEEGSDWWPDWPKPGSWPEGRYDEWKCPNCNTPVEVQAEEAAPWNMDVHNGIGFFNWDCPNSECNKRVMPDWWYHTNPNTNVPEGSEVAQGTKGYYYPSERLRPKDPVVETIDDPENERGYRKVVHCPCGEIIDIWNAWANPCPTCDREYDASGNQLAPRSQWGQETGEGHYDEQMEWHSDFEDPQSDYDLKWDNNYDNLNRESHIIEAADVEALAVQAFDNIFGPDPTSNSGSDDYGRESPIAWLRQLQQDSDMSQEDRMTQVRKNDKAWDPNVWRILQDLVNEQSVQAVGPQTTTDIVADNIQPEEIWKSVADGLVNMDLGYDEKMAWQEINKARNNEILRAADDIYHEIFSGFYRLMIDFPASYKIWPWLLKQMRVAVSKLMVQDHLSAVHIRNALRHYADIAGPAGELINEMRQQNRLPENFDINKMSLDDLERWLQDAQHSDPTHSGGEIVHDFGDGWTVNRLTTEKQLDYESSEMDHCVGLGGYDAGVEHGEVLIYSVRDPEGKPQATIEIDGASGPIGYPLVPQMEDWEGDINWMVEQVQGHGNNYPTTEGAEHVQEWFRALQNQGVKLVGQSYPDEQQINDAPALEEWYFDWQTKGVELDEWGLPTNNLHYVYTAADLLMDCLGQLSDEGSMSDWKNLGQAFIMAEWGDGVHIVKHGEADTFVTQAWQILDDWWDQWDSNGGWQDIQRRVEETMNVEEGQEIDEDALLEVRFEVERETQERMYGNAYKFSNYVYRLLSMFEGQILPAPPDIKNFQWPEVDLNAPTDEAWLIEPSTSPATNPTIPTTPEIPGTLSKELVRQALWANY